MVTPERLFLLDGMALAYRAYFSFIRTPLVNSKGENTSAIFGFVNTLLKILDEEKPEHVAVVFDTKEPTFRHKIYKPYKATRQKMPEDMSAQLDTLKEVVKAFGVPLIELPGYEADDIMGTLAKRAEAKEIETYLVTGDKDFMQLISPTVKMYKPGKQGNEWEILGEKEVREKFGVAPELVTDVLGLVGDKSDNIPGVPGVGEKTAIPLVQQFGDIENVLSNIEKIPQKGLQSRLRQYAEEARLSKYLVTIDTNVPLKLDLEELRAGARDITALSRLFTQLEFRTLLRKVSGPPGAAETEPSFDVRELELTDIASDEHEYHIVKSEDELRKLGQRLGKTKSLVIDTETTTTDALRAELVGISLAIALREAWYIPVAPSGDFQEKEAPENGKYSPAAADLFSDGEDGDDKSDSYAQERSSPAHSRFPIKQIIARLSPTLSDASVLKIGQNIKFDMLVLASHGIGLKGAKFDTMVANYVLRPEGQHNLDALAAEHLRYKTISYGELTGTGKDRVHIRDVPLDKLAEYSAEDADITARLHEVLKDKLEKERLLDLCERVEFPLIDVLFEMESRGVALDVEFLRDMSKELERVLENVVREIHRDAGEEFNINSTQQLGRVLFENLKLPVVRKTKTGYSTDVAVLETLRNAHPIVDKLLEFRQLQKLKSTYIDTLPALINPRTGRVHTSFNQTVAVTGRLSSSDPNLQNIPIRTEIGRSIRKAFIPGDANMLIMAADYSQIELRIMAHVSGDEELSTAFRNGEDIHATTAAKVFGVDPADVSKEMRRKAKEVNFGIMYGIGPYGLATRLDITQPEAKEIINKYFERFPKVNQYIFDTLAKARHDGYVTTLLGRRRYLPDINSRNQNVRGNAERQAINMPIQGTAADMIKLAMIRIHERLRSEEIAAFMLLQVHDELVFEVKKTAEKKAKKLVVKEMKAALPLDVPIEVEVGLGRNWFEAH